MVLTTKMAEDKNFPTNDFLNYYLQTNMNNICRICLEKGKLMPIFDPIKPPHFSILIMACAQVQVQEADGLPPYICHKCVSRLNIAFHFKTQCENSDVKLRNCFVNNKIQTISHSELQIPETGYISNLKDDSELNNTNISITFSDNSSNMNNAEIQTIQEVTGTNRDLELENNNLSESNIENLNTLPVNFNELKLELGDLKQEDINLNVTNVTAATKSSKVKKNNQHQCGTCGKIFKAKPSLIHHIRIHTGERPYVCHLCDKTFINGGHLHTHMKTHTGEKNHVCAACHKAFSTAQQLTKHTIAIHTSERPYACTYCTKRFASSSNLRTHMRIHTGEKNFRCEQCGKAFCTKGQLEQHILVHTGEKAFLCEYCHKRFTQKCHLMRHLKIHLVS